MDSPAPVVPAKRRRELDDDSGQERLRNGHPPSGHAPCASAATTAPLISYYPSDSGSEEEEVVPLYDAAGVRVGECLPDHPWPLRAPNSLRVEVPETTLIFPESIYEGFIPPAPVVSEFRAIDSLQRKLQEIAAAEPPPEEPGTTDGVQDFIAGGDSSKLGSEQPGAADDDDFQEFVLEDFSFYTDGALSGLEMRPPQYLNARQFGHTQYFFDAVLRVADERYFLRKVPFKELSVGNYGPDYDSVDGQIWIRSSLNGRLGRELYYKLAWPSKCYARYYFNFVWISNFAKYFVDYLDGCFEKGEAVGIHRFRGEFLETISARHGRSPAFKAWFGAYGKRDFRVAVSANLEFLYKEACGVLSAETVYFHRIFRETLTFEEYKPVLADDDGNNNNDDDDGDEKSGPKLQVPPTVVTPYIAHCFDHLPCGPVLEPRELDPKVEALRRQVADPLSLDLTEKAVKVCNRESGVGLSSPPTTDAGRVSMLQSIKPGDTISIPPDPESLSKWARETPRGVEAGDDKWYGLVQSVDVRQAHRSFNMIWFYRAVDTICGVMKYPIQNELFLSNHCTCSDSTRIDEDDVLGVHTVSFRKVLGESEFICRQTYDMAERRFTTYAESDRVCICNRDRQAESPMRDFARKYRPGDAVLVRIKEQLEPFELVEIDAASRQVKLRRLLRRETLENNGRYRPRPNEVVYTDDFVVRRYSAVERKCYVHVHLAKKDGDVPVPFNRDGAGNLFFTSHFWDGETKRHVPLEERASPPTLNPPPRGEKLVGLDLFCGVGNFGRGLEEGGAVEMRYANDISGPAIHAYMANANAVDDPAGAGAGTSPFLGSIDVLQARAMSGRFGRGVPRIGEVAFVAGGSPCPGFSNLTNDKTTPQQRKNQSLVAAFASAVDLYRPRYGILENVVGIVQTRELKREDVFCQLVCALVGMGYQVQLLLLDAWSHGSCQSRSRVFLVFAAPGEALPDPPPPSHSHTPSTKNVGLGLLGNGQRMAAREFHPAYPFPFRSAAAATADLPRAHDTKADYCVPFPDHVAAATVTPQMRSQVKCIPRYPPGMNFNRAWRSGAMTPSDRALFPAEGSTRTRDGSVGWARCRPGRLFSTVVTKQSITDCRLGPGLHWAEDRPLTLLEARRAQGFPDGEVLLGGLGNKWRAVGNSVAREVSLALGLAFREAIFGGRGGDGGGGVGVDVVNGVNGVSEDRTNESGANENEMNYVGGMNGMNGLDGMNATNEVKRWPPAPLKAPPAYASPLSISIGTEVSVDAGSRTPTVEVGEVFA